LPPDDRPYPTIAHAAVTTSLNLELSITRGNDILPSNQAPIEQRQARIRHHRAQFSKLART
jgi:hypothetical protein